MRQYKVVAEEPTDQGYRFTRSDGIGKGRQIWIDKKSHSLTITPGSLYVIETNRDLDLENSKQNKYIKLEKFSIELFSELSLKEQELCCLGGKKELVGTRIFVPSLTEFN